MNQLHTQCPKVSMKVKQEVLVTALMSTFRVPRFRYHRRHHRTPLILNIACTSTALTALNQTADSFTTYTSTHPITPPWKDQLSDTSTANQSELFTHTHITLISQTLKLA